MARRSIVLLKNNSVLPLATETTNVVVMGPNANDSVMMWGNYAGYPTHTITALDGIRHYVPQARYIPGCALTRNEVYESRHAISPAVPSHATRSMRAALACSKTRSAIAVCRLPIGTIPRCKALL